MKTDSNENNDSSTENSLNNQFEELDLSLTHLFGNNVELNGLELDTTIHEIEEYGKIHRALQEQSPQKRYQNQKRIDSGGMKDIWEVEDSHTSRSIAMAVIQNSRITSQEQIDAFVREAQLTANLQHPNIIPIYDVSLDENGTPFFTMKSLKGESLETIVNALFNNEKEYRSHYSHMKLLSIFQRVCDAISYAHSKGIVHLDLKPSNIIVCDYGEVQVIDWGISQFINELHDNDSSKDKHTFSPSFLKRIQSFSTTSFSTSIVGSPGYMAPEQITGGLSDITTQTDIYLLGGLLYFILTGKKPVDGTTIEELIDNTLKGSIIPADERSTIGSIPKALSAIAQKALSYEKDERYSSADDILSDIQNYIDGFATRAESATFVTQFKLLIKRHKTAAMLLTSFMVILLIMGIISIGAIKQQEQVAVAAKDVAEERLTSLQEKTEYIAKLTKQVAPMCISDAQKAIRQNKFSQFRESISLAMNFDDSQLQAWDYTLFKMIAEQRFTEAIATNKQMMIMKNAERPRFIFLKKYKDITFQTGKTLLSRHILLDYIKDVIAINNTVLSRYMFHVINMNHKQFTHEEHMDIIRTSLKQLNPNCPEIHLEVEKAKHGWIVDISDNPKLRDATPLCGLKLHSLNASYTGIRDVNFLSRSGLEKLSVAFSPIKEISARSFLRSCRTLDFRGTRYPTLNYLYDLPALEILDLRDRYIPNFPYKNHKIPMRLILDTKHKNNHTLNYAVERFNFHTTFSDSTEPIDKLDRNSYE